ncbi:MAG: ATP-grasp domain-containing protein [Candidatus Bathyarchaeia archaeon]
MAVSDVHHLLVIGIDTTFIASSAKSAGYNVYAVDYFDDVDLQWTCDDYESAVRYHQGIGPPFDPHILLETAKTLMARHPVDAVLLSSGLDDYVDVLFELDSMASILGNPPDVIRNVRMKPKFFNELKTLGIPYPETAVVENMFEAKEAADKIGYPVVLKPAASFGGMGIRIASNSLEVEHAFSVASKITGTVIIQKLVKGFHASMSILATRNNVKVLSINEQLLGLSSVFQSEPFGYCGNVVPLQVTEPIFRKCELIAKKIVSHFGLKGSNGIDIVISEDGTPYVIEVNPRFQGTLGCVERTLRINLVDAHVKACLCNELPTLKHFSNFCTRLILYAPKRVVVPNLTIFKDVRNIPPPQSVIEKGEPICSVLAEGETREASFQKADYLARTIYGRLRPF